MPHNLHKINLMQFCTRFHVYIHAYALLLGSRGLTLVQISTIESVVIASMFIMEIPTGIIADRLGRKWSLTACVFLMMCAELLFLFSRDYGLYLVVAFLTGTGFAFSSGATEALIYDSLPQNDRENNMKWAMGRYGSIGQLAFFISPLVGAWILGDLTAHRFDLAIAITVLMLGIGTLISLSIQEPTTKWEQERQNVLQIFQDGVSNIRQNRALQRLLMLIVLTTPFTGVLVTTFAAPTMSQNQVAPEWIAISLSLGSFLGIFTVRFAPHVETFLGKKWGLTVLLIMPALSWLLLASVSGGMVWFVIVWMYATNDMRYPLLSAYQNALIPHQNRATTLSLLNMFTMLFISVVSPVYALIGMTSLPSTFFIMGMVILVAGVMLRLKSSP